MNMIEYESVVEALLFAAGEPVDIGDIAGAIELDTHTTQALLDNLICKYEAEKRGITIARMDGSFQMCTNPRHFEYVRKVFGSTRKKPLTPAMLETLAIIAYKQPVSKSQVEHIRGVNADHCVNKLIEYSLVAECGRSDAPGKPLIFATTDEFLKHFGISSLSQLPALEDNYELLKNEAIAELAE
ncbi:MAG: SMC-Scp complex subunit ScpB [Defluviitaleaceae bacterium]|nr:SMC-Scp complex subunit ScpB [Defluviitaleaceae bacterium]